MTKQNFKIEFQKRLYAFVLKLIEFIDGLLKDDVSRRLSDQHLRGGTSVLGNSKRQEMTLPIFEF